MNEPWRDNLRTGTLAFVPGTFAERTLLLLLLLLAMALRAWRLVDIPFTHDEISALLRLRFSSFGALIAEGVAIDAHPAGVQVFEWLWTGIFGTSEAAVKLPFVLMSVAALFLLYRIASAWTNPSVGLLSIAFIGTIQYTVLYGQIARPYAAGFFTCALLIDQLSRAMGGRKHAWIGVAISAALCAYTHHFALLFAGIAGLVWLTLVAPVQRRPLVLAGIAGLLLYAPHIPIFLRQLGYAGVGQWLDPPGPYWLHDHVAWVFQFDWLLVIVVIVIAAIGWVVGLRAQRKYGPFPVMCLTLGLLPLLIGYGYSIWRAPVLQYSVLLFSFPFLVFPLFAAWPSLQWRTLATMTGSIALTAVYGLIFNRQHYTLFYTSKYEAMVQEGAAFHATHPEGMLIADCPPEIIPFYADHLGIVSPPFVQIRGWNARSLDSLFEDAKSNTAFIGHSNGAMPEIWSVAKDHLPFTTARTDLVEGGWRVIQSDHTTSDRSGKKWASIVAPQAIEGQYWDISPDLPLVADTGSTYGGISVKRWSMNGREFGILFTASLDSIGASGNDRVDVSMYFSGGAPANLALVAEVKDGDSTIFYRTGQGHAGCSAVHVSVELATVELRGRTPILRTYVWNRDRGQALVERASVSVSAGNEVLYGMFEPLPADLRLPQDQE